MKLKHTQAEFHWMMLTAAIWLVLRGCPSRTWDYRDRLDTSDRQNVSP